MPFDLVIPDINTTDITKTILLRMKAYYQTQDKIKQFLDKQKLASAADFFVEAVTFYLKLLLNNSALQVSSERKLKKGSIQPDISIWKDEKVVAIIECKTQLGWNRHKWEDDFIAREERLKKRLPERGGIFSGNDG